MELIKKNPFTFFDCVKNPREDKSIDSDKPQMIRKIWANKNNF